MIIILFMTVIEVTARMVIDIQNINVLDLKVILNLKKVFFADNANIVSWLYMFVIIKMTVVIAELFMMGEEQL